MQKHLEKHETAEQRASRITAKEQVAQSVKHRSRLLSRNHGHGHGTEWTNRDVIQEAIAQWVAVDNMPFSIANSQGFRNMILTIANRTTRPVLDSDILTQDLITSHSHAHGPGHIHSTSSSGHHAIGSQSKSSGGKRQQSDGSGERGGVKKKTRTSMSIA
jgi:hypothetical protein